MSINISIQTDSTRLVSFFRDRRAEHIYRAVSLTDGVTWTKPSKTTLPNNNSGIEATTLQSGHIAIVYNPTNKERYRMYILNKIIYTFSLILQHFYNFS
jgi:predicted neuraminidase